ncbi:MAG: sulfatase-like hydrolase/transferase [Myxococcota bacterium]
MDHARTPALDAIASRANSVSTAWSSSTWTVPSMISMFTGMPVRQHGWNREPGNVRTFPKVPPAPMLAEVMRHKGYETTALVANDFVDPDLGFSRGFDTWRKTLDSQAPARVATEVAGWAPGSRHFLYVHLLGPHSPLHPSEAAREHHGVDARWIEGHPLGFLIGEAKRGQEPGVREAYRNAYRAVVEDVDTRIGAILEGLGEHRDDTLVVITSDHGELLGEHGVFGHGWWVYEELVHVPLIVEGGVSLPDRVSGASIPAIITESLDLEHTWPTPHDATLLVSERRDRLALSVDGVHKGIWTEESAEAFSLDTDRGEQSPGPVSQALSEAREHFLASTPAGTYTDDEVRLNDATLESLRALGYLDAGSPP